MRRTQSQRLYTYFAIFIAALMALSVIFPLFSLNNPVVQDVEPTAIPTATQPAPPADVNSISFDNTYFHNSGLFTVAQPTGWEPGTPLNTGLEASITMKNPQYLTDVESFTVAPSAQVTNADEVSSYFSDVSAVIRGYSSPRETGRRVENDRSIIDFEATQSRQSYIGRQIAWAEDGRIYGVRVIAPSNMRDLLLYLLENQIATLKPNDLFADATLGWTSFYNPEGGEIIRYPTNWAVVDGRIGIPVTIQGGSGEILRIEVPAQQQVADEAAAQAYFENLRPGASVASVTPVERNGGSGFAVAYNERTLDGEGQSGLAVLLNGSDNLLHVASIRIPFADLDLNALPADAGFTATDAVNVMNSFNLTEGLGLPVPTSTPAPEATPVPPTPVTTEGAAVTEEAAATEEAAGTDEAAATEEAEETAEATEEAGS